MDITNSIRNMAGYNLAQNPTKTIFEASYSKQVSADVDDSSTKKSDVNSYLSRISDNIRVNSNTTDINDIVSSDSLRGDIQTHSALIGNLNEGIEMISVMQKSIQSQQSILTQIESLNQSLSEYESDSIEYSQTKTDIQSLLQSFDESAREANYNGIPLLSDDKDYQFGTNASVDSDITTADALGHIYGYKSDAIDSSGTIDMVFSSGSSTNDIKSFVLSTDSTGIKDLAEFINDSDSLGSLEASWEVKSSIDNISEGSIQNLVLNGVSIGDVDIQENDIDHNLIDTINRYSDDTGVTASLDDGTLILESDGRGIEMSADSSGYDISNYGSLTLLKYSEGDMSFYDKNSHIGDDGSGFYISLATAFDDVVSTSSNVSFSTQELQGYSATSVSHALSQLDTLYSDLESNKEAFESKATSLTEEMVQSTISYDEAIQESEEEEFDKSKLISKLSEYAYFDEIEALKSQSVNILLQLNTDMQPVEDDSDTTTEDTTSTDQTQATVYTEANSDKYFEQDYFNTTASETRGVSTLNSSTTKTTTTNSTKSE
jgi:hypothetical protein